MDASQNACAEAAGPLGSLGTTAPWLLLVKPKSRVRSLLPSPYGALCLLDAVSLLCPSLFSDDYFFTGSTGELLKHESSSAHLEGSAGTQRTRPQRQPCTPIMRDTSSTAFIHSSADSLSLGCPGEYKVMTDVQSFFSLKYN